MVNTIQDQIEIGESGIKLRFPTWILTLMPFCLFAFYVSLAIHCRFALGHWPIPYIENFSTHTFGTHKHIFIIMVFAVLFLVPVVWFLLLFFPMYQISLKAHALQILIYCVGWIIFALAPEYDPTPFSNWFFD